MKCFRLMCWVIFCLVAYNCNCFAYDLLEYYPLTVGSHWEEANDDYVTMIEGYGQINGRSAITRRTYHTTPFERDDDEIMSYDINYFYIDAIQDYDGDMGYGLGMYRFNPPARFKRNLSIGETTSFSTTMVVPDGRTTQISASYRLVRVESVSVPAGNFSDCLVIEQRINGELEDTEWWARGVGYVKDCEDDYEYCWVVGSYYIAGVHTSQDPIISSISATPQTGTAPLSVTFNCSATDPDGGEIVQYLWDFNNDGLTDQTTTAGSSSYVYLSEGVWHAKCTVKDDEGDTATSQVISITVSAPDVQTQDPVISNFTATPTSGTVPLQVSFNCIAHDPDGGSITEYQLDVNNDGLTDYTTTNNSFDFTFNITGIYQVKCIVIDNEGETVISSIINITANSAIVYSEGDHDYYLPFFKSGNGVWTGLGLANQNQGESNQLQVTVYNNAGSSLATEVKNISAYGQDAFLVGSQINDSGWMWVNSHQPLSGLAFLGSWNSPSLMADIPFISELSSCLTVPHIAQDDTWDTTILICNPNSETVSVGLKYVDKAGVEQGIQNYNILAHGSGEYLLSTVFSAKVPLSGRVEINSSTGIAVFALYSDRKNGGTYYAGINAESCEQSEVNRGQTTVF